MKRLLFSLLFLCSLLNVQGQNIPVGSIWQATTVYDTLGKKYMGQVVEEFIYFESPTHMLHLKLDQLMDNKTKEAIISYKISGHNFKQAGNTFAVAALFNTNFKIVNPDSLFYKTPGFGLSYRRIKTGAPRFSSGYLKSFLFNEKLTTVVVDPVQKKETPSGANLQFQPNGKVSIQKGDKNFQTDFRIINFGEFIFIKGISVLPFLAEQVVKGKLMGIELNNRGPSRIKEFRVIPK